MAGVQVAQIAETIRYGMIASEGFATEAAQNILAEG